MTWAVGISRWWNTPVIFWIAKRISPKPSNTFSPEILLQDFGVKPHGQEPMDLGQMPLSASLSRGNFHIHNAVAALSTYVPSIWKKITWHCVYMRLPSDIGQYQVLGFWPNVQPFSQLFPCGLDRDNQHRWPRRSSFRRWIDWDAF